MRNVLVVSGVLAGMVVLWLLPRSLVWRTGRLAGWLGYYLAPTARRVARANLNVAFGASLSPSEKERIARESMQNVVATLVTLFWSTRLNKRTLNKYFEIDPQSYKVLQAALARGKGVIFSTLHYGDWELAAQVAGVLDHSLTEAAQTTGNRGLDRLLSFCRCRSGNRVLPERRAFPGLLRTLQGGGYAALITDLNAERDRGTWVDFFGLAVYNHPTVGHLAVKTGAPVIYGLAHPFGDGRVRMEWTEIPYALSGDRDRDVFSINQACMNFAEQVIRKRPECWHWSYKRWKRRPTLEQGRYPYYSKYFKPRNAAR